MDERNNTRPRRTTSRRSFLEGVAAGGALAATGAAGLLHPASAAAQPQELRGADFDLAIGPGTVNVTGRDAAATLIDGSLPGPILRWREGDDVTIRVHNRLDEPTALHWHGILLPADMDGVPGLSFPGIEPGTSFTYRFPVRQSGTYWYHSHSGLQEQTGVYGALLIDAREPEPFAYDREHVVLLSDWTDRDPYALYLLLKRRSDYFNYQRRTLRDFARDARRDGFRETWAERADWARMRMLPSDRADVSGAAYTYLVNGQPPTANWTGIARPGERVRLRLINGSAMTIFDVRIPGLAMTVVAADGQYVRPVTVDELRIGVAEVLDVIVTMTGADAFTIFAQSIDRTGYARGTLAVAAGLAAAVPELDRAALLTMADLGHAAGGHAAHGAAPAEDHSAHTPAAAADHSAHAAGNDAPAADHAAHAVSSPGAHPASERRNPAVDMQADAPQPRLADPGIGLRNNGRRVLTYADLRSAFSDPDGREPEHEVELHLTGHMQRFMWSFDGVPASAAAPIRLRHGERVRFRLVNDTMMEHPVHLHGLWSDLEDESGAFLVRKHTISLPPGTQRSFRVTADALGRWALHCHLLYHMEAGMFREVRVEA